MGNFEGWLIKFGSVVLPNSFLLAEGWESTPNQRVELDAYRDSAVLLHRVTADNTKSKIKLNIRETTLQEMIALSNVINIASLPRADKKQRRVTCTYWNDETLEYTTGIFYISDITYVIYRVDEIEKDIEYNPFTITLTEY